MCILNARSVPRRLAQVCGVAAPSEDWSASAHAHALLRSTGGHAPSACGYHLLVRFSDNPDEVIAPTDQVCRQPAFWVQPWSCTGQDRNSSTEH